MRVAARLLLILALAGCDAPVLTRPNIVMISIDSLRADRLGCYGATRETSPALDELAATGALFETAMAPTSWTLPSHVSLLTGLGVLAHGTLGRLDPIAPERQLLAEHLRDHGYRTAAATSSPFFHRAYGFDRGFDEYANYLVLRIRSVLPPGELDGDEGSPANPAGQVIDHAIDWIREDAGSASPFFVFVHLWDPHYDYRAPEPYTTAFDADYAGDLDASNFERNPRLRRGMPQRDLEHLVALYDGEIRWTDSQIARLIDALRSDGVLDQTIVTVVADHGEEFFEHGRKGHSKTLFEESVRVPWIIRYPKAIAAGGRIPGVVTLADVAPTLLDLAGVEPLPGSRGRSLAAALGQEGAVPDEPALLALPSRSMLALRGRTWKVVLNESTGKANYYDLEADPSERKPRSRGAAVRERVRELRERAAEERHYARASASGDARAPVELDDETQSQLRELGYLK